MRGSQAPCDCGCGRTVNRANGSGVTPISCSGPSLRPDVEATQPPFKAPRRPSFSNVGIGVLADVFNALSQERFERFHV